MQEPDISMRDHRTYSKFVPLMEGLDEAIQLISLQPHVYEKIIAFGEEHGFRNHAEVIRICKSFAEKITEFGRQMEERGENTCTRVMPEETTGDTQNFTGGRPIEQDKENDKAPTMNEAPAAAGSSPKRERRAAKDEGPNSVTANH
jgi:hypothetical protein